MELCVRKVYWGASKCCRHQLYKSEFFLELRQDLNSHTELTFHAEVAYGLGWDVVLRWRPFLFTQVEVVDKLFGVENVF